MSAELTAHPCTPGARILFVREANGHSWERCSCGWAYDFDRSRTSDASALVGWTR